jgi:hypothetical protein
MHMRDAGLPEEFHRHIGEAAVRAAHAVGYRSAGTVEFIVDVNTQVTPCVSACVCARVCVREPVCVGCVFVSPCVVCGVWCGVVWCVCVRGPACVCVCGV